MAYASMLEIFERKFEDFRTNFISELRHECDKQTVCDYIAEKNTTAKAKMTSKLKSHLTSPGINTSPDLSLKNDIIDLYSMWAILNDLEKQVSDLKCENETLKSNNRTLKIEMVELQNSVRRSNLTMLGVNVEEKAKRSDVKARVKEIMNEAKLGHNIVHHHADTDETTSDSRSDIQQTTYSNVVHTERRKDKSKEPIVIKLSMARNNKRNCCCGRSYNY